ncbi:12335_t:CDS:2, partial [Racocetra persica]
MLKDSELNVSNENRDEKNGSWNEYNNKLDISDEEWGDEDNSRWDYIKSKIKELNLSTYYDKYRPNSIFTKAAVKTKKITSFFTNSQPSNPNNLEEISDDSD